MKSEKRNIRLLYKVLLLLFIYSCNESPESKLTGNNIFNSAEIKNKLSSSTTQECWEIALTLVNQDGINHGTLDTFLVNNDRFFFQSIEKVEPKIIDSFFYYAYYKKDFELTSIHFAKKIQQNTFLKNSDLFYLSAAILSHYYLFYHISDSLSFQIDLLKNGMNRELPQWIKISYFSNLGSLFNLKGRYLEASINMNKALSLTGERDTLNRVAVMQNLASVYLSMEYYEKAKSLVDSTIALYGVNNLPKDQLNTFALIYTNTREFNKADSLYNEAIKQAKSLSNFGILAQTYSNFANMKRKQNKFHQALNYMSQSDSICDMIGLDFGKKINAINRAELYFDLKRFTDAEKELKRVYTPIVQSKLPQIEKDYYEILYRVFDSLGDQNQANLYFRKYAQINSQLQGDYSRSIINEWELSLERENKSLLSVQNNQLIAENKKDITIFISVATLLIFGAGLIFYALKSKNMELMLSNQRKEFEMEIKSKELLAESLKNISIESTKTEIQGILSAVSAETNPEEYRKILLSLNNKIDDIDGRSTMVEFQKRFATIHEGFYEKLRTITLDLTPNETIICAMLKLNYSSKEIAFLTNRTVRTIENNRSIIRKKLNLDSDTNLQQYLFHL